MISPLTDSILCFYFFVSRAMPPSTSPAPTQNHQKPAGSTRANKISDPVTINIIPTATAIGFRLRIKQTPPFPYVDYMQGKTVL